MALVGSSSTTNEALAKECASQGNPLPLSATQVPCSTEPLAEHGLKTPLQPAQWARELLHRWAAFLHALPGR
jgi:hypothetical protein